VRTRFGPERPPERFYDALRMAVWLDGEKVSRVRRPLAMSAPGISYPTRGGHLVSTTCRPLSFAGQRLDVRLFAEKVRLDMTPVAVRALVATARARASDQATLPH